jgi:hypothetical protein
VTVSVVVPKFPLWSVSPAYVALTVAVWEPLPPFAVKVTWHCPDALSVQEAPIVGVWLAPPVHADIVKVTIPVGVIEVPLAEVSATVTVQVAVPLPPTLDGEQTTETLTLLKLTVTLVVPELAA